MFTRDAIFNSYSAKTALQLLRTYWGKNSIKGSWSAWVRFSIMSLSSTAFFPPLLSVWVLVLNASRPPSPSSLLLLLLCSSLTYTHQFTYIHRLTYIHPLTYTHPFTYTHPLTYTLYTSTYGIPCISLLHTEAHFKLIFCDFALSASLRTSRILHFPMEFFAFLDSLLRLNLSSFSAISRCPRPSGPPESFIFQWNPLHFSIPY